MVKNNLRTLRTFTITKHGYSIVDAEGIVARISRPNISADVHVTDIKTGRKYTFELTYDGTELCYDRLQNIVAHNYVLKYQNFGLDCCDRYERLRFRTGTFYPLRLRKVKSVKQLCRLIDAFMEHSIEQQLKAFTIGYQFVMYGRPRKHVIKSVRKYRKDVLHNRTFHADYRDGNVWW